jgi:hypothetical protein
MLLAIVLRVCGASPSIFHWWRGDLIQGLAPFESGLSFLVFLQKCWFRSLSASFLLLPRIQSVSTYGTLAVQTESLNGSVTQRKNQSLGNWFLIAVLHRSRSLISFVSQLCQVQTWFLWVSRKGPNVLL